MNRASLAERKLDVLSGAAERFAANLPRVTTTARRLAAGGPSAAASPDNAARFRVRETRKRRLRFDGLGFERVIGGTVDFEDTPPSESARQAGRPVARIVELLSANRVGDGFATGFLIAGNLLGTNWHVFADKGDAIGCAAQFGFERNEQGMVVSGTVFELDPGLFFLSDKALDIAIVGVKPAASIGVGAPGDFGTTRLIPALGKILVGHPVSIIQHPDGRHKHWAVQKNTLLVEPQPNDLFLTYSTDTLEGSSGSPAFNFDWELVAVHHSGVPRMVDGKIMTKAGTEYRRSMPESDIDWIANEGARVSKIHELLKKTRMATPAQQALLDQLINHAVDPIAVGEIKPPSPPPAKTIQKGMEWPMNVVVNGTANFYYSDSGPRGPIVESPRITTPSIGTEAKIRFDPDYAHRPGYDPDFFEGFAIPLPTAPLDELLLDGAGPKILKYHHYSLVMHRTRRLAMWAAANVDYHENKRWRTREEFGTDTWKPDPRIAIEAQIEDLEFYEPAAKFDRGHIMRRDDVAWGHTKQEEEYGNSDSFHWTNCSPQHEGFNRDMFGYHGLWGGLENHIAKQAKYVQNLLVVMAGPVLDPNDPSRDFGSGIFVKVPIVFWKVLVAVETTDNQKTLRAYGFTLDQTDAIQQYGWEGRFRAGRFAEHQVSLSKITEQSRVVFPDILLNADPLAVEPNESRRKRLNDLGDVRLK